jgi:hypothetical protein
MTVRSPFRTALVAVALVAAVGGCKAQPAAHAASATTPSTVAPTGTSAPAGDTTSPAGSTSAPGSGDACSLIAVAGISAAFNETMTQTSAGPAPFCSFANGDQTRQLIIHIYTDQSDSTLTGQISALESSSEHIDGLGDDAFWAFTVGMIYVRQGGRSFTMASSLTYGDPAAWKATMVQLATTALPNL